MDTSTLTLPTGWISDHERAALHEAATQLMTATGFDYLTAVQHVELAQRQAQRNPPAKAAPAAPAGGTTVALAETASRLVGAVTIITGGAVELIPWSKGVRV